MPVLSRSAAGAEAVRQGPVRGETRGGLFESCANPYCRTGWMHLWRSRTTPVFEGGWSCSPACTAALVAAALSRETDGRAAVADQLHRHRIPLGLILLRQGWITHAQLRQAVEAQKAAGSGRLGYWLMRQQAINELQAARALGLQWGCPVLRTEFHDADGLTTLLPRLFVDAFGALPLRVAANRILYLGFEDRLDPVLALAVERMTGLRVESGIVPESEFRRVQARVLRSAFPAAELVEASSELALQQVLARRLEKTRPIDARLVRVHDCFWLRLWRRRQGAATPDCGAVEDLIGSVRSA